MRRSPSPSRRTRMRVHTAALHEELHHQSPFADIERGEFGPDEVAVMEALHRRCWAAYAHDDNDAAFIKAVGSAPAALFGVRAAQDRCVRRVDPAGACGAAYVYLGSKFGGALLGRRLEAAGFTTAARQVRQSESDKTAWARLLASLESLREAAFRAACEEANYAFGAFRLPSAARVD